MDERLRFVARLLEGEKMAALCRVPDELIAVTRAFSARFGSHGNRFPASAPRLSDPLETFATGRFQAGQFTMTARRGMATPAA